MSSRILSPELLVKKGIGELYHNLTIEDYKGEGGEVLELVKTYLVNIIKMRAAGLGLFAYGSPGTGKTFLMIEVLKEALRTLKPNRQFFDVRKTSLGEIVHNFTNSWYERSTVATFEEEMIKVDFLLIDDVEKAYISDGNRALIVSALDKVLRVRIERKRPILITTNENPAGMATMFGDPIASLLAGHCRPLKFVGGDFRKEDKAAIKWSRVLNPQMSMVSST